MDKKLKFVISVILTTIFMTPMVVIFIAYIVDIAIPVFSTKNNKRKTTIARKKVKGKAVATKRRTRSKVDETKKKVIKTKRR